MRRRTLVTVMGASPLLAACWYERFFDLEWDEEVQLHDGRAIVVHIKHRYMRIEQGLTFYAGTSIPIGSTLTLDTGSSVGTVVQYFKGFQPIFLDQHQGEWYGVLTGKYHPGSRATPGQDWGDMEGPLAQWAIKLTDGKWKPISMSRLPVNFKKPNMSILYGRARDYAVFNKKRLSLVDKVGLLSKFSSDSEGLRLGRPNAYSVKRPDSVFPTN